VSRVGSSHTSAASTSPGLIERLMRSP
jgi:hypothetical protein